ncbi:MAG: sulfatase-like hydrolase/transferase [Planctomycetes bacterium]|nr:sulfatase-like hydrolase/transferase [Planctomycetota bacterium]
MLHDIDNRDHGELSVIPTRIFNSNKALVVFTSDNGPTFNGGSDSAFFASAGPLRGLKTMVYEGGIRVPFIARWPGRIEPGRISHHVSAFWDFFPTCCDILGIEPPVQLDGISMLPALTGRPAQQRQHDYLYWELNGQQALRLGDYKAIRKNRGPIELYDLGKDIGERRDLAAGHPDIVAEMKQLFESARNEPAVFPLVRPQRNAG